MIFFSVVMTCIRSKYRRKEAGYYKIAPNHVPTGRSNRQTIWHCHDPIQTARARALSALAPNVAT